MHSAFNLLVFPNSMFTPLTATEPGSASRSAEVRKNLKYEGLCDRYIFQAIAIETSCVFGRDKTPSFPDWVTWPHQSAVNVAKLNFSANVCHLQHSVETPNL